MLNKLLSSILPYLYCNRLVCIGILSITITISFCVVLICTVFINITRPCLFFFLLYLYIVLWIKSSYIIELNFSRRTCRCAALFSAKRKHFAGRGATGRRPTPLHPSFECWTSSIYTCAPAAGTNTAWDEGSSDGGAYASCCWRAPPAVTNGSIGSSRIGKMSVFH